jgi:hypothetical protein
MYKVIQLISNFLYNKNMPPFYESTCSLDQLDKKPNHTKCQSLKILKEKTARQRAHFLNHLTKKICSMSSKCLAIGVGHMCRK